MQNQKFSSLSLLLSLGFIWGTGYSIARFATTHGVPPLGYSFWQSVGPAILISLFCCFKSEAKIIVSINHVKYYIICGLTGIVIPNTNMYLAAPHLPAGLLAVIVNIVPIIAYPLALIMQIEKFNFVRCLGVLLAISGLMILVIPKTSLPSPEMIPWVISALLTPFSFAWCGMYIAKYRPTGANSLPLAAGTLIASSLLLFPLVYLTGNSYNLHWAPTMPDLVIILEIILSSVGYVLLFRLIKIAGPVYYSLVDTVVALTGLGWGFLLFHEHLNQWTLTAVILILFSLLLVTWVSHVETIFATRRRIL